MTGESDNKCDFCHGSGVVVNGNCVYCNGTGEWNQSAQSYVNNHICQCIVWDREHCPVCKKKCHHNASLSPKQVVDSGFGGQINSSRNWDDKEKDIESEMENYA